MDWASPRGEPSQGRAREGKGVVVMEKGERGKKMGPLKKDARAFEKG